MNRFKEMCIHFDVTQTMVSKMFGIPYRTIQGWYLGEHKAPEYIIDMMYELLEYKLGILGIEKSEEESEPKSSEKLSKKDKAFLDSVNNDIYRVISRDMNNILFTEIVSTRERVELPNQSLFKFIKRGSRRLIKHLKTLEVEND